MIDVSSSHQEFVVTYMLEPLEEGTQFTQWPLHATLLPWFEAPNLQVVVDAFQSIVEYQQPVITTAEDVVYFGPRKLAVRLLQNTDALQQLHDDLLAAVTKNAWPIRGRYTGEYFKPHVTTQRGVEASGTIAIDRLYIFESQPQGYRKLQKILPLG